MSCKVIQHLALLALLIVALSATLDRDVDVR
jgi:hypothetical protein